MLEPMFDSGSVARMMGSAGEVVARRLKLPDICTIAEFKSDTPARDGNEAYSSLRVIWFQNQYGLPDAPRTQDQLHNLEWDTRAYDWTP